VNRRAGCAGRLFRAFAPAVDLIGGRMILRQYRRVAAGQPGHATWTLLSRKKTEGEIKSRAGNNVNQQLLIYQGDAGQA